MQLVDDAALFPGACLLSGSGDGPFVDTGRHYGPQTERIYIQELLAVEIGEAIGMASREAFLAALERVAQLELELAEERGAAEELANLKAAVRETFAKGAVRLPDDSFKLRPKPGQKAPVL